MGAITLSNKPNGTSNWADGDTVTGAGMSADLNILANAINGNLDTANLHPAAGIVNDQLAADTLDNTRISPAADIAPTKVGDYSATAAQANTFSSPGSSAASTPATDMTKELEQLRYALRRIATGANARITNGTTSGLKADGNAAWFDPPIVGPGIARNASFLDATAFDSVNPPYGWVTVNSPSTLSRVALTAAEGAGEAIRITDDGGADCGISQTFIGLRASSLFLVVCRMQPGTSTFKVTTTGATGTFGNLALVSASGGLVWQTLSGIIATDAAPGPIVMSLVANAANASCLVSYFDLVPLGDDKIVRDRNFTRSASSVSNLLATVRAETTIPVVVPGPKYRIDVTGLALLASGAGELGYIQESTDGATFANVSENLNNGGSSVGLLYSNENPVAGQVYWYRLNAVTFANATGLRAHRIRVELKRS